MFLFLKKMFPCKKENGEGERICYMNENQKSKNVVPLSHQKETETLKTSLA